VGETIEKIVLILTGCSGYVYLEPAGRKNQGDFGYQKTFIVSNAFVNNSVVEPEPEP
jgi:hypothetical protein